MKFNNILFKIDCIDKFEYIKFMDSINLNCSNNTQTILFKFQQF